ncbi:MAG TPA: HPr family phosphocarrier protein [Candidatus Borkfalkia avistercoris]|uniref:HPr family phosphocarrier protein n=1 Tax=Candidatus Borkfalkia avistercoris TaxID=2838504 RepID=A0A9D2D0A7_9FIRM|nr:HPr family phosphocarrier protein [Candidatus Borkfalkia avistercoris]
MNRAKFVYKKDSYNAYDAQRIVFEACKFKSEVTIENGDKRANAKSIIGLVSMKFVAGDEYTVMAEGADSRAAASGVAKFISELS